MSTTGALARLDVTLAADADPTTGDMGSRNVHADYLRQGIVRTHSSNWAADAPFGSEYEFHLTHF